MTPALPSSFLTIPLAHRAYHDISVGRPENSRAAVQAAIDAGYGIEIDLQLSSDNEAMVFHDYGLDRLTLEDGPIRQRPSSVLQTLSLKGSAETIPTLWQILDLVAGRVPVLIEIKDQDGGMGPNVGPLEEATARAIKDYLGPVAVMSFNPNSVVLMAELAPTVPRGLTTDAFDPAEWPLSTETCTHLRAIPDIERAGAVFISHDVHDLDSQRVVALRRSGLPVLTWTVKSQAVQDEVAPLCDNITFEGYPARPLT